MNDIINDFVNIGNSRFIHKTSIIYNNTIIHNNVVIEENCIIGKPYKSKVIKIINNKKAKINDTLIRENCYIQVGCLLYEGVKLGEGVICRAYSTIGLNSIIGNNTKIHYRAQIFKNVEIGSNCRIGGFICNESKIGDNTSIYGSLVHHYPRHGGFSKEKSPEIGSNVVIAFNSTVIGGVVVSNNSYIAAGAIVTVNIPSNSVVLGVNQIYDLKVWNGRISKQGGNINK